MPFGWTVNPFRGCEVGCRYCYARPTHEYLGHTDPGDFEERIYVKTADDEPVAPRSEAGARQRAKKWRSERPRIPISRRSRGSGSPETVLEAMVRVPGLRIGITTKSAGVIRDMRPPHRERRARSDLSGERLPHLARRGLLRLIEPRAPRPDLRLRARASSREAGIRTRIFVMPVLPLITDGEAGLRALLIAARRGRARRRRSAQGALPSHTRRRAISFSTS